MPPSIAATESVAPPFPPCEVEGERRFLIYNIAWSGYEKLLEAFGDGMPRVTYLDGTIELTSPGPIHEQFSEVFSKMITILTVELDIPVKAQGSTTIKRRGLKRGLDPDKCFYLESLHLLRGRDIEKLKPVPRPDLVIEVEVTSPLLDRREIYAKLGVPEIWKHDKAGLTILGLQPDGSYRAEVQSRAFPFLPIDGFRHQLSAYDPDNETTWARAYWTWVREVVEPRYRLWQTDQIQG